MTEPTDIMVPCDQHAEAFVVGARMLGAKCERLPKELFFRKDCRVVNGVLNLLQKSEQLTDVGPENSVRVYRMLIQRDWMQHVGNAGSLVTFMEAVTHLEFLPDYIERLKEMQFRRQVLEHAGELIRLASDQFGDVRELNTKLKTQPRLDVSEA